MTLIWFILAAVVVLPIVVVALTFLFFFGTWIRAKSSGVEVSFLTMVGMRLRNVDPNLVINCAIMLSKAGVSFNLGELEAQLLAGGNLLAVTEAAISANKAGLDFDFRRLAAVDLAGRDVVDAVRTRVQPRTFTCPEGRSAHDVITGVCRDGVRLGVRARVTVRTDLNRLVGGAGQDTVTARVGEGIVTAIGRAASHKEILEHPEAIAKYILERGLDAGTYFEILSVDISDVDVQDNVGARLQTTQADTDKQIARARAEIRRAAAVAAHQEMEARTLRMHSRVVGAEANVPLAMASAFQEKNLGRQRPLAASLNTRIAWKWNCE